jgi:hypothetical protein
MFLMLVMAMYMGCCEGGYRMELPKLYKPKFVMHRSPPKVFFGKRKPSKEKCKR